MIEFFLFLGGFAFGSIWFGFWLLPVVYGTPKALYHPARAVLRPMSVLSYLPTVLLWSVVFTCVAVVTILAGLRDRMYNSSWCFVGQWLGVLDGMGAALSRGVRQSLNEDFWQAMAPYQPGTTPMHRRTVGEPKCCEL